MWGKGASLRVSVARIHDDEENEEFVSTRFANL
jgi:hypothetical protein